MRRWRRADGQAAVELVGVLPFVVVLCAVAWQFALAGWTWWSAGAAARAAARAVAVGGDARMAARRALPGTLERGLVVRAGSDGSATVRVRVPSVGGVLPVGTMSARARFAPQGG